MKGRQSQVQWGQWGQLDHEDCKGLLVPLVPKDLPDQEVKLGYVAKKVTKAIRVTPGHKDQRALLVRKDHKAFEVYKANAENVE